MNPSDAVPVPDPLPTPHEIDTRSPRPPRGPNEILRELVLIVPHLALLLTRLLADPRVAFRRKLVAAAAVAYLVSPIDLIPDMIPVIGQADDVIFLAFAVHHLLEGVDAAVRDDYWHGSEDALDLVRALIGWGAEMMPPQFRRWLNRP